MEYPKSDYKEYPKTLPRDDFWGQVRRTRDGRPITEEEVDVIVSSIRSGLGLSGDDCLLDLACGNGALSSRLFADCAAFVGVDDSEYLVEVARDNFEIVPTHVFRLSDVSAFVDGEADPGRFTKALCYASIQFLPSTDVERVVVNLHERFENVSTFFLGNIPDRDLSGLFYRDHADHAAELSDPTAQIGTWYTTDEISDLAQRSGWQCTIRRLPAHIFNSFYRFDAVLWR